MPSEKYPGYNLAVEVGTWALENKLPGLYTTEYTDPSNGPLRNFEGTCIYEIFKLIDFIHEQHRLNFILSDAMANIILSLGDYMSYMCYSIVNFLQKFNYAKQV